MTIIATPQFSSTFLKAFVLGPRPTKTEMNPQAGGGSRYVKMQYHCKDSVQAARVWLLMEEKASWRREMVFGLDFTIWVFGIACAKAEWLLRGTPNSST